MKKIIIQLLVLFICFTFFTNLSYGQISGISDSDLFEEMERMHLDMEKFFDRKLSLGDRLFESSSSVEVVPREDERFKYIELRGEQIKSGNLDVEVRDGAIQIRSSFQTQSSQNSGLNHRSISYSSYSQSFPIPEGVDGTQAEFERKGMSL